MHDGSREPLLLSCSSSKSPGVHSLGDVPSRGVDVKTLLQRLGFDEYLRAKSCLQSISSV